MRRVRKLLAQGRRLYPSCRVLRHQWVRKTMQLEDTGRHALLTGGWKRDIYGRAI